MTSRNARNARNAPLVQDSMRHRHDGRWVAAALAVLTLLLLVLGLCMGSTGVDSPTTWNSDPILWQIVTEIRAPRTWGAWLAGALLGLSGAVAQGLFRNPLADPYLLGSASGAALGSAVAMVLLGATAADMAWAVRWGMTGMAFVGAAGAVGLTLLLAQGTHNTLRLLLSGVVVGVVLGALRDMLELGSPDILQAMKAFALGSTALVGWDACGLMALALAVCWLVAQTLARGLDALRLGGLTAESLGLPLRPMRIGLIAVLALATGTAVAQTGLIAFVGLAAPHMVRSLCRVGHATSMGLSAVMGGVLLLAADIAARWVMAPQEMPVGVITALLGGSYLLWLMHQRTRSAGGVA